MPGDPWSGRREVEASRGYALPEGWDRRRNGGVGPLPRLPQHTVRHWKRERDATEEELSAVPTHAPKRSSDAYPVPYCEECRQRVAIGVQRRLFRAADPPAVMRCAMHGGLNRWRVMEAKRGHGLYSKALAGSTLAERYADYAQEQEYLTLRHEIALARASLASFVQSEFDAGNGVGYEAVRKRLSLLDTVSRLVHRQARIESSAAYTLSVQQSKAFVARLATAVDHGLSLIAGVVSPEQMRDVRAAISRGIALAEAGDTISDPSTYKARSVPGD